MKSRTEPFADTEFNESAVISDESSRSHNTNVSGTPTVAAAGSSVSRLRFVSDTARVNERPLARAIVVPLRVFRNGGGAGALGMLSNASDAKIRTKAKITSLVALSADSISSRTITSLYRFVRVSERHCYIDIIGGSFSRTLPCSYKRYAYVVRV